MVDTAGAPDTSRSRMFNMEVTREHFPWVVSKGGKESRVIATLESLTTILALKAFSWRGFDEKLRKIWLQPTWTDNRGDGSAHKKVMSTHFPVNALLMELVTYCKHAGTKPTIEGALHLAN